MSSKGKECIIDAESLEFLRQKRAHDRTIVASLGLERQDAEFRNGHAERLNNWKTDEIYIERSQEEEANFLHNLAIEEQKSFLVLQAEEVKEEESIEEDRTVFGKIMSDMKDLKLQCLQNKAAAELRKSQKKTLRSRRIAVQDRLKRLEIRQEKERKSLSATHQRYITELNLTRNIVIQDIEDPELRCIVAGVEVNEMTLAADAARFKAAKDQETRAFNAKVFAILVRNTKEVEQLREIHLLKLKNTAKYCDLELDSIDEIETMKATHIHEEHRLEAELKARADKEEEALRNAMVIAKAKQAQSIAVSENAIKAAQGKREAKLLRKQQKEAEKERLRLFWNEEEKILEEYLKSTGQPYAGVEFEVKAANLLDKSRLEFRRAQNEIIDFSSDEDEIMESLEGEAARVNAQASEDDKRFSREMYRIEHMRKTHAQQVQRLKIQNRKTREACKKSQHKALQALVQEHEADEDNLRSQQEKEMFALLQTQKTSEKVDEDNRLLNDRLNAMLPRFVVEAMKRNEAVQPRQFDNLILLTSDIVSFTSLSSQSSAKQIISLLNRLYSAMDETLDSFHDVFKLETIGDAYCIVAGLNSQDRSPHLNAVDVVECAISFVEIVQNLDMSDQISDSIQMRVGIHCGPAVGGVANSSQPKFSLFGDTTSITGIMEQTSKPNRIHISESLYNLVKDDYEFDVSESVAVQDGAGGKKKMATYWLVGRKQIQRSIDKPTATGSMSKINRIKSGVSRGIRFDQ